MNLLKYLMLIYIIQSEMSTKDDHPLNAYISYGYKCFQHQELYDYDNIDKYEEIDLQAAPYLPEGCFIRNHNKIKVLLGISFTAWLICSVSSVCFNN